MLVRSLEDSLAHWCTVDVTRRLRPGAKYVAPVSVKTVMLVRSLEDSLAHWCTVELRDAFDLVRTYVAPVSVKTVTLVRSLEDSLAHATWRCGRPNRATPAAPAIEIAPDTRSKPRMASSTFPLPWVSMIDAATATAMPASPTNTVSTTPDAAPALAGGTTACVATEAKAQASPRPNPVRADDGM